MIGTVAALGPAFIWKSLSAVATDALSVSIISIFRCASVARPSEFSMGRTTRVPCSSNRIWIADSSMRRVSAARDKGVSRMVNARQNRKRSHLRLMIALLGDFQTLRSS